MAIRKKTMHGYAHFSSETLCAEQQAEVVRPHRKLEKKLDGWNQIRLLELIDTEAKLRDDVSLEGFIAGFHLACGIVHGLGVRTLYSFHREEQRISGA